MKRSLLAFAGAAALAVAVPASASATITELGLTATPITAPTCPKGVAPANCTIILTRATALATIRDDVAYPTTAAKSGRIVAFTVGLSNLSSNTTTRNKDISYLDTTYGGATQVAITILKPVGARSLYQWDVVAESPLFAVQPYLGQAVQFPLTTSLPVARGDVIALTTPTWAPVLSIDLSTKEFAYRQSRRANCAKPPKSSQAQLTIGRTTRYGCDYPGTRVEYSATEVTNPTPTKTTTTTKGRRQR